MATIANGESGLSVRTKLNNVIGNAQIMEIVAGSTVGISISGNAATATSATTATIATTLAVTRTIWGQNFNGSANITGNLTLGTADLTMTGSIAATGARVTKGWFTDIESTNMPTVGGTSLTTVAQVFQNKTITNSNNVLGGVTMTLGSDAIGDVYYRSAGGLLARLAAGAAGTFFRFAGASTIPTVSTLVLPNTATANRVAYASATNTYGESANLTFDGTTLNIGAATSTGSIVEVKADTAFAGLRSLVGSTSNFAFYLNQTTPSATNYSMSSNGTTSTNINSPSGASATGISLLTAGIVRLLVTATKAEFTPTGATSGAVTAFSFTTASTTGQTASTEVPAVDFNTAAPLQNAAGAVTIQRTIVMRAASYTMVSSATRTDVATLGITGAPISSTNSTHTNAHGLLISAGAVNGAGTTTNAYGLTVNAPTGATNNFAVQIIGGKTMFPAGTTGYAPINLAPGVAPTSPVDGDLYYVNTNDRYMVRKNATDSEIISASAVTTEVVVSDTTLTVTYNGTTYKLLARA